MEKNKDKNQKNKLKKNYRFVSLFVSKKDKDFFTEHVAMMLSSGMDVLMAISAMQEETHSRTFQRVIQSIKEDIEDGSPLWKALQNSGLLTANVISLIKVGEQSGRLAENLKVVVIQQRKEQMFSSRIRSAVMYPVFVLSLTVTVGLGVAWFILPRLANVFSSMKMTLPLVTKILITFGVFLGKYGSIVVPTTIFVIFILVYFLFFFSKLRFIGQWILFRTPGINNIIKELQLARFGYILGTLLDAGLPVLDAIDALAQATTFKIYKNFYKMLQNSVEEGKSFKDSFLIYKKTNSLMPIFVQQMISSGEQSGRLSETLNNIGNIFEDKTDNAAKNLAVMLEPVLLVIVALGVFVVALAVILPIYSLVGGLSADNNPTSQPINNPEISATVINSSQSTSTFTTTVPTSTIIATTTIMDNYVKDTKIQK